MTEPETTEVPEELLTPGMGFDAPKNVLCTSWNSDLIVPAFARVLSKVKQITKTREVDTGKFKYKYADLGDVVDEVHRVLADEGLVEHQPPSANEAGTLMSIRTIIYHIETGQWITWPPLCMAMPRDPQAFGSAQTYARRYALLSIFAIAPEDDDGAEATRQVRAPAIHGGNRSGAEQEIRALMNDMPAAVKKEFTEAFREQFRSTLAELAVSKHGDALGWAKQWKPAPPEDAQRELAADDLDQTAKS